MNEKHESDWQKPSETERAPVFVQTSFDSSPGQIVNASGYRDQLNRQYGLLSICGLALTVDNAWVAIGTSLAVAVSNGGPAGVIYEFIVAVFYYTFIAASIAEVSISSSHIRYQCYID